jgi:hypothetical protein
LDHGGSGATHQQVHAVAAAARHATSCARIRNAAHAQRMSSTHLPAGVSLDTIKTIFKNKNYYLYEEH